MTAARRTLRTSFLIVAAAAAATVATASPAAAHTGRGPGGVVDGILHPITGLDHLFAMLAVGIVAAVAVPSNRVWAAPAAFLGGMVAGGTAGIAGLPIPGAELLIIASVFALGVAIAGAVRRTGVGLVAALVVAGLAHGHAHGAEAPTSAHPVAYVLGFVLATGALHLAGVGVGMAISDRRTARMGIGAATVAAGALLLA